MDWNTEGRSLTDFSYRNFGPKPCPRCLRIRRIVRRVLFFITLLIFVIGGIYASL